MVVKILGADDAEVLGNVESDVFDNPIDPARASEFFADPRHHIAVAMNDEGIVVGFASAVHYVHPDKDPELWINEVGVSERYQRQGIASRLMRAMIDHGRSLGCNAAWVLTEHANEAAVGLYESLGGRRDAGPTVLYSFPQDV